MSVAIDLFWQFGCQEPLSRRKIQRVLCNIRHAGGDACRRHAVLRKKNGQLKHEGCRSGALDKRRDIEQQLEEMVTDEDEEPLALLIGYSQNSYQYEEQRLLEDEDGLYLEAVHHGLREGAKAATLIGCPGYFEDQVSTLESDFEIGGLTTALSVEHLEREAFEGLAA